MQKRTNSIITYVPLIVIILFILFSFTATFVLEKINKTNNDISSQAENQSNQNNQSINIGKRTKTSNCKVNNSLPDLECTPGAVFAEVTKDEVCTSGYSKSVRNVPQQEKDQIYAEYGILTHKTGEYEVDHFISLELGGSNDIANLWPEAAEPRPGFHEKDQVENYLHDELCSGKITLIEAQKDISTNWLDVYNNIPKRGQ